MLHFNIAYPNALIGLMFCFASQALFAQEWAIQPLPLPASMDTVGAMGINNHGDVVGQACRPFGRCNYSFLYHNGVSSIIPVERKTNGPFSDFVPSYATAINDKGEIIGNGGIEATLSYSSYYYFDGKIIPFGTVVDGYASAITNQSIITVTGGPVTISNDQGIPVNLFGDGVNVIALSDNGYSVITLPDSSAPLLRDLNGNTFAIQGQNSEVLYPKHVNNQGQVLAAISDSYIDRAIIWENGIAKDIGSLGGSHVIANALNDQGWVVGYANIFGDLSNSAFLYDGSSMHNLLDLPGIQEAGWTEIINATAINDLGQIVGVGTLNGNRAAFLMSPIPVPPASALMMTGLTGLFSIIRQKRTLKIGARFLG